MPPVYPEIARIAHVEGKVVLEATIDEWGVVKNVTVRQSQPLLDKAAIEAVSKWRYAPTRLNGQPIAIVMMVTVTFTVPMRFLGVPWGSSGFLEVPDGSWRFTAQPNPKEPLGTQRDWQFGRDRPERACRGSYCGRDADDRRLSCPS